MSTVARRNGAHRDAIATNTRVARYSTTPEAAPTARAVPALTSLAATGGRANTAAIAIATRTIGSSRHRGARPARTARHAPASATNPATATASSMPSVQEPHADRDLGREGGDHGEVVEPRRGLDGRGTIAAEGAAH